MDMMIEKAYGPFGLWRSLFIFISWFVVAYRKIPRHHLYYSIVLNSCIVYYLLACMHDNKYPQTKISNLMPSELGIVTQKVPRRAAHTSLFSTADCGSRSWLQRARQ